jgi:hypothetical protein
MYKTSWFKRWRWRYGQTWRCVSPGFCLIAVLTLSAHIFLVVIQQIKLNHFAFWQSYGVAT